MHKVISYGPEVRNKIVEGASLLKNVVASTLGPVGRNVIIYDGGVRPLITKDGATVAYHVDSNDSYQKIGIQMIKDVVGKVDSEAGDGTTTTTLYSTSLLEKLTDLVNLGVDANELRKGLERATKDAVELLSKYAVKTEDIESIARVSANGDEALTSLLTKAYSSIGDGGSVVLADSWKRNGESYVEVSNGIKWAGGIPSSLFITNNIESTAVIENPYVMILASGVNDIEPLKPYIEITRNQKRNLVLIAPYFEQEIWAQAASLGVCLIMSPGKSLQRTELHDALLDLAVTIGTKVVPDAKSAIDVVPEISNLGQASLIVSSLQETNITQPEELSEEHSEVYEKYIEQLKQKIESEDNELTPTVIEMLKERLARLSGGIATIHIGALTPSEKEEKIALLEDAQHSIGSALKYGVLPGGGTALLKVAQELSEKKNVFDTEAEKKGYEAVLNTMREPAKALVKSVKPEDYQYIVQQVAHSKKFWEGYNVRSQQIEDLEKSKIMDSAAIEIFALKYACSEIGSFVISDGVIVNANNNVNYDRTDPKAMEARYGN